MEKIRLAARDYIKHAGGEDFIHFDTEFDDETVTLHTLWTKISSHDVHDISILNEDLLVVRSVLKKWVSSEPARVDDEDAVQAIYAWLVQISLPSSEFAQALESEYSADGSKKTELTTTLRAKRSTFSLAISCIKTLNSISPVVETADPAGIIVALASFTNQRDPWTTSKSHNDAVAVLQSFTQPEHHSKSWEILRQVSESKIRPIFAKTKTPAVTAAGRKNLHPTPQPRFDANIFNPETKPWKHVNVYATTVLEWVVSQYTSSEISRLESQFHFYVPPILSLIDDESLAFKFRGCNILIKFLNPIRERNSDLLRRTNLSSVFDDALTPNLHSLPTITPEDESLQILGVSYEAFLLTLQSRYHINQPSSPAVKISGQEENKTAYRSRLTTLLRENVISSFHHISSYTPTSKTEPSALASFPYPRLSTFILNQLRTIVQELGIHTTKYLQEIVPIIYSTLTNPFGTAHLPLLAAGVATAQAVILNSHPRIWRYRGEFLAALCECWIHVSQDEKESQDLDSKSQLQALMKKLQGTANLLKIAVLEAGNMKREDHERVNWAGVAEGDDIDIGKEMEALMDADENLRGLFQIAFYGNSNDDCYCD